MRFVVAGLVIAALALGIWLFWPQENVVEPTTTTVAASPTTTVAPTPTTAAATTTSTTGPESHVVTTVEEAEEILRELWFGWFEGIYNQDIDRIREVVATEEFMVAATDSFGLLPFTREPDPDSIELLAMELLRTDDRCIAVLSTSNVEFLDSGPARVAVDIMRLTDSGWRLFSSWTNEDDLWDADCESQLLPLP